VNAAFLLVTSACLMGDAPPAGATVTPDKPAPAAAAPAPVYTGAPGYNGVPANGGGCGCGSYDTGGCGCGCESEGWFSKLKGHLRRHGGECGCETAESSCGCGGEGFLSRLKGHFGSSCSSCGESSCGCGGESFFGRLKGHFRHSSDCGCGGYETGGSCGCNGHDGYNGWNGGVAPGAPVGEPVKAPKDLDPGKKLPPDGDKPVDKPKEAKIPAPFETAPAATNTVEKDNRNPF
jgi:hypothetical protein